MSYDDDWPDEDVNERREAIRETIRRVDVSEIRALGKERFGDSADPWAERFNRFLNTHPKARYYQAEVPGGFEIAYCHDTGDALWFLPGSGMGVVQEKGKRFLKELVNSLEPLG